MKSIITVLIASVIMAISNTARGQSVSDTLKTVSIKVNGISCNGDMPLIKKKLINQEGIDEVSYSGVKNESVTFTVKYHSSVINEKKIRELIESAPSCDNPNEFPYKVKISGTKIKKQ